MAFGVWTGNGSQAMMMMEARAHPRVSSGQAPPRILINWLLVLTTLSHLLLFRDETLLNSCFDLTLADDGNFAV
jgi:hypothetical protein